MEIETSLMVDDYPTPPNNSKTIKGRIELTYSFEVEVPDNWDRDRIEEDIRENLNDYLKKLEEIDEIDF